MLIKIFPRVPTMCRNFSLVCANKYFSIDEKGRFENVQSPRANTLGVAGKIDSVRRQRYHERILLVPPTNTGSN